MHDDALSRGLPFELNDILWKSSLGLESHGESLFRFEDFNLGGLDNVFESKIEIPQLEEDAQQTDLAPAFVESELPSPASASIQATGNDASADIWTLDLNPEGEDGRPKLRTWEAFEKKATTNSFSTAYLSEAGPSTFDAVLTTVGTQPTRSGSVPQDVMLEAICNLVLGRSSIFFQWNLSKQTFEKTLDDVPVSGYSLASDSSFTQVLVDVGSKHRVLHEYTTTKTSTRRSCTALVAFKGCVSAILDAIESRVTLARSRIRSMLQLQNLLDRPHQLLQLLSRTVAAVHVCHTDEAIISALSDQVHQHACTENIFNNVLREILARVSKPWLERLEIELGLREPEIGQPFPGSEGDEGAKESLYDSSVSFVTLAQDAQNLPSFIKKSDRNLIHETKRSLRLLRQHLPSHYMTTGLSDITKSNHMPTPAGCTATHSSGIRGRGAPNVFYQGPETNEHHAWMGEGLQENYLAHMDTLMSQTPQSSVKDQLQATVSSAFDNSLTTMEPVVEMICEDGGFAPLEQLRPTIMAHSARINRHLLRHVFRTCRLRHHLGLQHRFHLLGNGNFVLRLSKALFSTDTQTAERKQGRIPTGDTMGLRLGSHQGQRWPPASSEIQLTLMGILTETYYSNSTSQSKTLNTKDLPGGLSFSIRELSEAEIEKVVDSNSIHALDFLKLHYTPPAPLDAVLTPTAMQAYDDIFRFLLKLLRVSHVTTCLREKFAMGSEERGSQAAGARSRSFTFAIEAHHCILVLMSHFMDVGIASSWNKFDATLRRIETTIELDEDARSADDVSIDRLRHLHEDCLESIRTRLFLRRKQQKLRIAVGDVLSAVLKCASLSDSAANTVEAMDLKIFEDSLRSLMSVLRATVDKQSYSVGADDSKQDEVEALRILFLRLNWNGCYDGMNDV